jgi:predicted amidohydrolase
VTQPLKLRSDPRGQVEQLGTELTLHRHVRPGDLLLLPELVGGEDDSYEREVGVLAQALKAWVVGGSHRKKAGVETVNTGVVADPSGRSVAYYEKANPYGNEVTRGTTPGTGPVAFEVANMRCVVAICADFWHRDTLLVPGRRPDLILVPALSVSRHPHPQLAQARWRHLAITRAYEFASFVAISDWACSASLHGCASSGVAGFAHPNANAPSALYRPLGRRTLRAFELDLMSLEELRRDQIGRSFNLMSNTQSELANESGNDSSDARKREK